MQPKVFRSTGARVAAWAWLVFAAANLADVAVRGRDLAALIAAAVLLLGSGLAYVLGLRPRVVADENGVQVHNPLRDVRIPWPALHDVEVTDTLLLHCTGDGDRRLRVKAAAMHTSPRARARAERRTRRQVPDALAAQAAGRTPADFVAEQLTELAAERRKAARRADRERDTGRDQGATRTSVSWSRPAALALGVPATVLAVLVLAAVLT
jgi:hypothetical protein